MSDEQQTAIAELAQMLRDKMPGQPAPQTFTPYPQPTPAPAPVTAPGLRAVLFRCSVPLPDGSELSAFLMFDAEQCQHPQAIEQLGAYVAQTWPVQTYQPRQRNGYGGGYRGGYGGGGYRGGGYGGRRYGGGYGGGRQW